MADEQIYWKDTLIRAGTVGAIAGLIHFTGVGTMIANALASVSGNTMSPNMIGALSIGSAVIISDVSATVILAKMK